MNKFFTKQQVVTEYHLPDRLQVELFRAMKPVEQDGLGEPLYLEGQHGPLAGRSLRRRSGCLCSGGRFVE